MPKIEYAKNCFYRSWVRADKIVSYSVQLGESDLFIRTSIDLRKKAQESLARLREELENFIQQYPVFRVTLEPWPKPDSAITADSFPPLVQLMIASGRAAGVGPMAAVAGAIAELLGTELSCLSDEVIIENGGDIYLRSQETRRIAIYAGTSPLSGKVGFLLPARSPGWGVCTSSGTVGHSLSFGRTDALTVVAKSGAFADAWATALANQIKDESDIPQVLDFAAKQKDICGVVAIKGEKVGCWGNIELCPIEID